MSKKVELKGDLTRDEKRRVFHRLTSYAVHLGKESVPLFLIEKTDHSARQTYSNQNNVLPKLTLND